MVGCEWLGSCKAYPFFQMAVKGVLFYQGESDSHRPCADYLADHKRLVTLLRRSRAAGDPW